MKKLVKPRATTFGVTAGFHHTRGAAEGSLPSRTSLSEGYTPTTFLDQRARLPGRAVRKAAAAPRASPAPWPLNCIEHAPWCDPRTHASHGGERRGTGTSDEPALDDHTGWSILAVIVFVALGASAYAVLRDRGPDVSDLPEARRRGASGPADPARRPALREHEPLPRLRPRGRRAEGRPDPTPGVGAAEVRPRRLRRRSWALPDPPLPRPPRQHGRHRVRPPVPRVAHRGARRVLEPASACSPDGRYGATTTFVNGDSYADAGFSTRTVIIDLGKGDVLFDLEKLDVTKTASTSPRSTSTSGVSPSPTTATPSTPRSVPVASNTSSAATC